MSRKKLSDYICRNCGSSLTGEFCANCGQEDKEVRQPILYFIRELLRVTLELDGRAYRTLWYLMARPGFLTREFFSGRRVTYTPPLRLFLIISIGFFLMIGAVTSTQSLRDSLADTTEQSDSAGQSGSPEVGAQAEPAAGGGTGASQAQTADTGDRSVAPAGDDQQFSPNDPLQALEQLEVLALQDGLIPQETLDNVRSALPAASDIRIGLQLDLENGDEDDISDDDLEEIRRIADEISLPFLSEERNANLTRVLSTQIEANIEELREDPVDFLVGSLEYVTVFMLLMMPILALIQKTLFVFCHNYYVEHLVLTMHNHAFIIFSFFLMFVANAIENSDVPVLSALFGWIGTGLTLWLVAYLFLSLKVYFRRGYLLTGFLFFTSTIMYGMALGAGVAVFAILLFIFS